MGRGLVAAKDFKKGQIVESSHIIVLDIDDHKTLQPTLLNLYVFEWRGNDVAVALGNGSLFNHAKPANVTYSNDYKHEKIVFRALRRIKKGEQLFVNYGYDPVLWYDDYLRKKELIKENRK